MHRNLAAAFAIVVALLAAPAFAESWTGWITDEHCGASGAKAEHVDCLKKCRDSGIPLAFYDTASKTVYQLSGQDVDESHLGHPVVVRGALSGDTIEIESIEAAGDSGSDG